MATRDPMAAVRQYIDAVNRGDEEAMTVAVAPALASVGNAHNPKSLVQTQPLQPWHQGALASRTR